MTWGWGPLRMFGYDVIVADPPWRFDLYNEETGCEKGAAAHYETMPIEDIQALRVGDLARGDALLFLWATAPMLPQAIETMRLWGFAYVSEMVWRKVTKNGKPAMGPGYRVRTLHEPILIGKIGNPQHPALPSIFDGIRREHSRKPEEFYRLVDERVPVRAGRCDLFSRQRRKGWNTWGREVDKFVAAE